ncbi:hypothetical protein HanHA300_Chr12g0452541 [Helianthus annuus]|nr:hypothetical protein HanHA300_Chr12g0452541 [Helianthus annuus]KAJ0679035.1 hypothetical protein HanOQP8_Chr12g0454741 [Helianthus annuus]KAJ0863568.1 hypothetical protein HanPSC8_Chr12g0531581 [Helianthus annuus]
MMCSLEEREDDATLFVPGRETEDDMASGDVTQAQANGIVQGGPCYFLAYSKIQT